MQRGTFVPPTLIEIDAVADLPGEVFGPVLHVLRYRREDMETVVRAVNRTGFGLTFGVHSRIDETIERAIDASAAGNQYVNRNMIGAVVGVQPFGGHGLSGTGPKAGGPLYLQRLIRQAYSRPAKAVIRLDPALSDLAAWLDVAGDIGLAALARQLGAASSLGMSKDLPGPVGERNRYVLQPRGLILLRPQTRTGLIHQLALSLATGNTAVCEAAPRLRALLSDLPSSVRSRLRDDADGISAALIEGEPAQVLGLLAELAGRPGPIVTVHAAPSEQMGRLEAYCPSWLVDEVSYSINTAAAGGNASLMALS